MFKRRVVEYIILRFLLPSSSSSETKSEFMLKPEGEKKKLLDSLREENITPSSFRPFYACLFVSSRTWKEKTFFLRAFFFALFF